MYVHVGYWATFSKNNASTYNLGYNTKHITCSHIIFEYSGSYPQGIHCTFICHVNGVLYVYKALESYVVHESG